MRELKVHSKVVGCESDWNSNPGWPSYFMMYRDDILKQLQNKKLLENLSTRLDTLVLKGLAQGWMVRTRSFLIQKWSLRHRLVDFAGQFPWGDEWPKTCSKWELGKERRNLLDLPLGQHGNKKCLINFLGLKNFRIFIDSSTKRIYKGIPPGN